MDESTSRYWKARPPLMVLFQWIGGCSFRPAAGLSLIGICDGGGTS